MSSKNICVEDVRIYQEAYIYYEIKTTFYIHTKNENLLTDRDNWNIILGILSLEIVANVIATVIIFFFFLS